MFIRWLAEMGKPSMILLGVVAVMVGCAPSPQATPAEGPEDRLLQELDAASSPLATLSPDLIPGAGEVSEPFNATIAPTASSGAVRDHAAPMEKAPGPSSSTMQPPALQKASRQIAAALATEDLATRLGVSAEEIGIVQVYPEEFPASNLGCPQAKGVLADRPAFVTGQGILLSFGEGRYLYHARGRQIVFCGER
jgi:hypothetical protein